MIKYCKYKKRHLDFSYILFCPRHVRLMRTCLLRSKQLGLNRRVARKTCQTRVCAKQKQQGHIPFERPRATNNRDITETNCVESLLLLQAITTCLHGQSGSRAAVSPVGKYFAKRVQIIARRGCCWVEMENKRIAAGRSWR